jgi:hypothetical protein
MDAIQLPTNARTPREFPNWRHDDRRATLSLPNPVIPMRLLRVSGPFDDPEFIFEPKIDAFLALTYLRGHH